MSSHLSIQMVKADTESRERDADLTAEKWTSKKIGYRIAQGAVRSLDVVLLA